LPDDLTRRVDDPIGAAVRHRIGIVARREHNYGSARSTNLPHFIATAATRAISALKKSGR
jgi:hypothetical protein